MRMRQISILLVLLAPVQSQDAPVTQVTTQTAPALHHGWLLEILDGNFGGAASLYEQAGEDETIPAELRALALARRVELERLRTGGQNLDLLVEQLEILLREIGSSINIGAFRAARRPVPTDGLAQAAAEGENSLRDWLESHRGGRGSNPMDTRPLVPDLYTTFLNELNRSRQARDDIAQQRLWREMSRGRRFRLTRPRAVEYLDLVLDGRQEDATQARRFLRSSQVSGVPVPADPSSALQMARRRLDSQLARVDLNPEERRVLRRLQERLGKLADEGQDHEAYDLLRNLPVFGDLLLGPGG